MAYSSIMARMHVKFLGMSYGAMFDGNETILDVTRRFRSALARPDNPNHIFLTVKPRRNAMRVDLDDRLSKFSRYMTTLGNSGEKVLVIYDWAEPEKECTRCGICCMFDCDDNEYGTPVSTKEWPGKGNHRCSNLQFDEKNGLYGCAMLSKRSMICEQYLCHYMEGENNEEPGYFGKIPYVPDLDGKEFPKGVFPYGNICVTVATQVEWFIAYTRKHQLKKKDMERACSLKQQLLDNMKLPRSGTYTNKNKELRIDDDFRTYLISLLDSIIRKQGSC